MKKILLVEDDQLIASGLKYALEQEGYQPRHCQSVAEAEEALSSGRFDLALLDMQLPDGSGFDVQRLLKNTDTAVIFLTVVDGEGDIVRALDAGAADYITKPFRLGELLARIRRSLNRGERQKLLSVGGVSIDQGAGKVFIGEREIELTALEYRLLLIFANNPSRLLTRSQILESIWDCGGNFVEDNTLTVYIKRLREKLGDAVTIETVRGLGYRVG